MILRLLLLYLFICILKATAFKLENYDYAVEEDIKPSTNSSYSNELDDPESWSDWSDWADCSRSCDGGVSYQVRRCNSVSGCKGEKIRYQICNMQPCDTDVDFRAEQCAQYNGNIYNSQVAIWSPHIDAENPCSLTCITQNGDIVTLNSKVKDGTRCSSATLDMCIDGLCQNVGCDLQIGSSKTIDSCGVCGGDDSTCNKDSEYYYYWQLVASDHCSKQCDGGIKKPKLICRSRITEEEVKHSYCKVEQKPIVIEEPCNTQPCTARWVPENWGHCSVQCGKGIRIRKYYCAQEIDGTRMKVPHHHCQKLHKPKTQEPCFIQACPPKWISQKWSPCSVQCGEGIQTRNVTCNEGRPDVDCAHLEKPADVRTCTADLQCDWNAKNLEVEYKFRNFSTAEKLVGKLSPSEPAWMTDEWGYCNSTCGYGVRKRKVHCKIFLEFSKTFATLPDNECYGPKPSSEEKCVLNNCVTENRWVTEPWSNCSVTCGEGFRIRTVLCKTYLENAQLLVTVPDEKCTDVKPIEKTRCVLKPCVYEQKLEAAFQDEEVKVVSGSKGSYTYTWKSDDFTQCSQSCLQGTQENIVMCIRDQDSRSVHPGLCDQKTRPEVITRTCNDFSCPPRWQTGEFQRCSKACGLGFQQREVICIHEVVRNSTSTVPNNQCPQPPPPDRQYCAVIDCPIQWHTDKWSKCSKPCGGGVKTRKVECKQEMAQSHIINRLPNQCPKHKPVDKRPCNTKPCASELSRPLISTDNSTFIQSDPDQVKVHLKVGTHATVYYNTQLKIKCPVHQFDRSKIRWTKDQQIVRKGKNYKISKKGALKIVRVTFVDNGVFTCRAGQSSADITIIVRPKPGVFVNSDELPPGDGKIEPSIYEPGKQPLRYDPEDSHEKNPTGVRETTQKPDYNTKKKHYGTENERRHTKTTQSTESFWPFQSYNKVRGHSSMIAEEHESDLHSIRSEDIPPPPFPMALAQKDDGMDEDDMGEEFILGKGTRENLKFEWILTDWSRCSQPCGGNGFQMRAAHCMVVLNNKTQNVDANLCDDSGLTKPITIQKCGSQFCPIWKTGMWEACDESRCFTWNTAMQTRTIWCEAENGTHLNDSYCEHDVKPITRQECYNDLCKGVWKVGEWSECSAACDADGIKYRILQCVWYGTKRPAGNACRDQTRPSVMRTCRGLPCISNKDKECKDHSKYCVNVKKMNLCRLERYQRQCCHSCK